MDQVMRPMVRLCRLTSLPWPSDLPRAERTQAEHKEKKPSIGQAVRLSEHHNPFRF
jgi:hypothetical protein